MNGATIAQLIIALGPPALDLIADLSRVWNQELTPDQVLEICNRSQKSYDQYVAEARARLIAK